ncbi:MAG: RNA helicase [Algicola sp.]|nr:RNA helicase [Algicola sp.]
MEEKKDKADNKKNIEKKKCGIIMPIASNSDYPKDHWNEVLSILVEAVNQTEFVPRLVSDDVAIGLIHERIVNNIYTDEIVICDVSSKNPNVMFELGMRLAFDKPTIIIKDEKTGYSFDTGVMEHINYPSSLRFNKIVDFKKELVKRINATYERSVTETNYSPFLKSFGKKIVPAKINQSEIAESKYILSKLDDLAKEIAHLRLDKNDTNNIIEKRRLMRANLNYENTLTRNFVTDYFNQNSKLSPKNLKIEDIENIQSQMAKKYGLFPSSEDVIENINKYLIEK